MGNDLSNVARSEVDLRKKKSFPSSISTPSPFLWASISRNRVMQREVELKVCTFQVRPYRVASVQEVKHLYEDATLQYFRNSLRILESSRGPHAAREFDTPGLEYSFL